MTKAANRRWLRAILKPVRPVYREVAIMSFFVNCIALATPIFVLQVYDRVVFYAGLSTLKGLVVGMIIVLAFDLILRQSRARMLQKAALHIDAVIGRRLFDKLVTLPLAELERRPSTFWQALFRDLEVVRNTLSGSSAVLVIDLPFAALFILLVFIIAEPVAWVMVAALPIFLLLAVRSGQVLNRTSGEERQAAFARERLISEVVAGRATVKALALDDWLRPRWEHYHASTIERSLQRGSHTDSYVNIAAVTTVGTTVAVTTFGAIAIIDQQLTIGALIAANILIGRIAAPFNQLVSSWRGYAIYRQAIERLGEVFALAGEATRARIEMERPRGELTLENVGFTYPGSETPALEGLRAQIKPPGMLGIVGANGSGKTTLLKVMQSLYPPDKGRVLLDGADLAQFSRPEIAGWIGYVPQECVLFDGTIRDNLIAGAPQASDADVLRVSELGGLHRRVIDLAEGYGCDVGEGGMRLPGGFRQRIAIARALLKDPPIVLMDEPSSNLDHQGEQELTQALSGLAGDHMVVVVTHSPTLLAACRMVVVLDGGRIARVGAPHEVVPELVGGEGGPVRLNTGA